MVRLIMTMIFIHINLVVCVGQIKTSENKILFSASFDKDSVFMGAPLRITISYKNNSKDTLKLYPEGRIAIMHHNNSNRHVYYETERIAYILREYSNRNIVVWLKPEEEIKYIFDIEAKESFFYKGKNTVKVHYRNIWDTPDEYKKRKKQKGTEQDTIFMVYSPPIKIIVNSRK
jgi:hypothetical protein